MYFDSAALNAVECTRGRALRTCDAYAACAACAAYAAYAAYAASWSRSARRMILPMLLRGTASTMRKSLGTL